VRFLVDAQLPAVLARTLISAGHQAESVRESGLRDAEDQTIWDYALAKSAVIVTKDEDFAERSWRDASGPLSSGCGSETVPTGPYLSG
jgi:predicted nuclease of predicted toxin-antitoxin system